MTSRLFRCRSSACLLLLRFVQPLVGDRHELVALGRVAGNLRPAVGERRARAVRSPRRCGRARGARRPLRAECWAGSSRTRRRRCGPPSSPMRSTSRKRSPSSRSAASPAGWPSVSLICFRLVEVEDDERELPAVPVAARDRHVEQAVEAAPVEEAGERVVPRVVADDVEPQREHAQREHERTVEVVVLERGLGVEARRARRAARRRRLRAAGGRRRRSGGRSGAPRARPPRLRGRTARRARRASGR